MARRVIAIGAAVLLAIVGVVAGFCTPTVPINAPSRGPSRGRFSCRSRLFPRALR